MPNQLTIRDAATREVIGTPHVGGEAVLWQDCTATLRSLRDTVLQDWISAHVQRIAEARGSQDDFLDRLVTVQDEYRY